MLKNYLELLKKLIDSFTKTGDVASFSDYIEAIKCTFIILFSTLGVLVLSIALMGLPYLLYKKVTHRFVEQLNNINTEMIEKQNRGEDIHAEFKINEEIAKKLRRAKILYWVGFTAVYIPFMIPTILFLGDLFLRFIN